MEKRVYTASEAETEACGRELAGELGPGSVVALYGDLGAGKTAFVRGLARGLDIRESVSSPTFTIVNEYPGRIPLFHFDMYRLSSKEEAINCGFEEYFDLSKLKGVVIVEWASNTEGLLPTLHVEIELKKLDDNKREIIIKSKGWV